MLGSLAYVAPLFGADTLTIIEQRVISTAHSFFSPSVVNEIIEPTIRDIAGEARGEVVSLGFVISLWAGSSAMSAFVDSVVEAHDQTPLRHPVRQRLFALFLYIVLLMFVVVIAPLAVVGPRKVGEHIPTSWANVLHYCYYPALVVGLVIGVMLLYRVALPVPLPSHRLIFGAILATTVFVVATLGLRFYLRWITSTGYTYGALSTPIAFLLLRVLRRLRGHDRRRTQRRRPGRVPGAQDPRPPAAQLAGVAHTWRRGDWNNDGFAAGAARSGDSRAAGLISPSSSCRRSACNPGTPASQA